MLKWHERYSVGRSLLIQKQAFGGKNMICGPSMVTAVVFSHEMTICPPSPFLPPEISKIVASERILLVRGCSGVRQPAVKYE